MDIDEDDNLQRDNVANYKMKMMIRKIIKERDRERERVGVGVGRG